MANQSHPKTDELANLLEFETLISDTSASLFAAQPDQLDHAVEIALERVRTFFQADRCALLAVSADYEVVRIRLASYGEGVIQVPTDANLAQMFPWSRQKLFVEGEPVRVSRMSDLPPDAESERDAWMQMSIRSALTLPFTAGGRVRYLIVLNTVHRERDWPDTYLPRLRVLGEVLTSALDRQAMVKDLSEAEERVHLATDSAGAGVWTLDFSTGIFWVTERGRAIFGYAEDEIIDLERLMATIHPDDQDRVRTIIDHAKKSLEPLEVEYRIIRPGDDRVRWITSSGRTRFSASGKPEQLTGVSVDITRRKREQEARRLSELRLASGADLAGLAFYELNYAAGSAYIDGRFIELCGLTPDDSQGLRALDFWLEHLHPEDRRHVLDMRDKLHDGTLNRLSMEYRFLNPVRGLRWIQHLAGVARRDADGRATATYGVLRDITEGKQIEEDLRDLSRRLIRAHEDERALLARELHDDVTQRLAVLAIDVGRMEHAAADPAQSRAMQAIRDALVRLSEDIHSLAYQLHPSVLEEIGLVEALRTECERRGRNGRLEVAAELRPLPAGVSKDTALCLFRVAQEALSNVARHAGARTASLTLLPMDGGLLLAVRDDGVGFDQANRQAGQSLGLASMRERVRLVEGTLDIESAPGQGTSVAVWIPGEGGSP